MAVGCSWPRTGSSMPGRIPATSSCLPWADPPLAGNDRCPAGGTQMATPIRVLGFAGSLRRASYNRAALRAAVELMPEGGILETFDLASIPLYHGDVEAEAFPPPVLAFKDA